MNAVYLELASTIMLLAFGFVLLLFPHWFERRRSADNERRLADRLARGEDAYFEELRDLQSYGKPLDPRTVRFFGAALSAFAVLILAAQLAWGES